MPIDLPLTVLAGRLSLTKPIAFLDVETTGFRPESDRIVEISVTRLARDGSTSLHNSLVNPGIPIPASASAVHHIDDAKVAGAPRFPQLAAGIEAALHDHDLCGYNLRGFDLKFLRAEFERCNRTFHLNGRRVIDPMTIYQKREPRNLAAALKYFCGIDLPDAHSADADVRAVGLVLMGMLEKYSDLEPTIEALHQESRHPEWIDEEGKVAWQDGEACLAFGKMQGKTLRWMLANDRGYLTWMLKDNFAHETKEVIRRALAGEIPKQGGQR